MLHRAEIVDLCNDEAARISDQSFSNFLIKYVFIEEKIIPFSTMIETCFQINQSRTIEACNILLNVFSDQGVREYLYVRPIRTMGFGNSVFCRGFSMLGIEIWSA